MLAGSVLEAQLLWALQSKKPAELAAAAETRERAIDRLDLHDLIECAHSSGLITDDTRTAAALGKEFRNLIHPGRTQRLAKRCNRATALQGLSAVEAVIR